MRPLNYHKGQLNSFNTITWLHKYRPAYTKQVLAPPLESFPSKILCATMFYITTVSVGQVSIQVFRDVETRGSFAFPQHFDYGVKFVISGCRREVDKNCALLGYYAANSGNFILTFRDNLSVRTSRRLGPIRR
jgi:hypothetical protein